ncbi:MAG: hypothetical protein PHD43_18165 [Methylococcales bacterium]|nr:hypothetical protein [Methylococcales bacterium]
MEKIGALKGIYRDILSAGDGRIIHDSGWVSNTIVDRCRILLAGFVKNESSSGGIQFLAVGRGLDAWDKEGPPASEPAATIDLVNRHAPPLPVNRLNIVYLDEAASVVANPTNRLQITATLVPGYPPPLAPLNTYPLREFGLFGRFDGNDYMINSIRHPVIHKDADATLVRVIRLYF